MQSVLASQLVQRGIVSVQDEAAGIAVALLDPQPGDNLLDACAAPGGKAISAAQRMLERCKLQTRAPRWSWSGSPEVQNAAQDVGHVVALDANASRQRMTCRAVAAAGLRSVVTVAAAPLQQVVSKRCWAFSVQCGSFWLAGAPDRMNVIQMYSLLQYCQHSASDLVSFWQPAAEQIMIAGVCD